MDKITEYEQLYINLAADVSKSAAVFKSLRDELFIPLKRELDTPPHEGTDAEVLRKYIKVSRDIQKLLFDEISTHVLTIERLADHILCKRQALARNTPKPKAEPVLAPPTSIFEKLQQATKGMSIEEIEAYMKKLKGEST